MTTNKNDRPSVGTILIFITISLATILGLYLATIYKERLISDRATELVGTLRTGEHIIVTCDRDKILVLPVDTTPFEIGILQGSYTSGIKDIDRYTYHPIEGKPTTILIGCIKVEIVKDPDSNWMLNIYTPPTEK
jgi:hypothetical protein